MNLPDKHTAVVRARRDHGDEYSDTLIWYCSKCGFEFPDYMQQFFGYRPAKEVVKICPRCKAEITN